MNVRLTPEHEKWLTDRVAAGEFSSVDDAVAAAIDRLIHRSDDDLAWAQPYIDQGDASLARGDGIPGEQFLAESDRRIHIGTLPESISSRSSASCTAAGT